MHGFDDVVCVHEQVAKRIVNVRFTDRKGQKQMNSNSSVELTKIAKSMELKNLTPDVDISSIVVTTPDINRPALQLTGYFEHFASERVQIVGYVEFTYLEHMTMSSSVPIRFRALSLHQKRIRMKISCVSPQRTVFRSLPQRKIHLRLWQRSSAG